MGEALVRSVSRERSVKPSPDLSGGTVLDLEEHPPPVAAIAEANHFAIKFGERRAESGCGRGPVAGVQSTALRRNGAYRAVYRFEWLSRAAAIRVHYARPILVQGRVVGVLLLSRSARSLFKGLYEDRGKIVLGVLAIFGLLIVLSGVLSRGVTRPIERLGAATREVAAGRGTVPDPPSTASIEIQGLYADFATMAAAIERRSSWATNRAIPAPSTRWDHCHAGFARRRGFRDLLAYPHDGLTCPDCTERIAAFPVSLHSRGTRTCIMVCCIVPASGLETVLTRQASVVRRCSASRCRRRCQRRATALAFPPFPPCRKRPLKIPCPAPGEGGGRCG